MNTYDLIEAAKIARVHKDTLRKMAANGEVPGTKIGRSWIFPTHLFDSWIENKCLSTNEKDRPTGGSVSQSLASRLARRREQITATRQKSLSKESENDSGDSTSSGIARRSAGVR
jgi:excisionase family DNA binding protein